MKFNLEITETLQKSFSVEAESKDAAIKELYRCYLEAVDCNGQSTVLDYDSWTSTEIKEVEE